MIRLEVACNSWESCVNAEKGGADRIELFENLSDGGCTPSAGLIYMSTKLTIPIYVMIRPRGGDFCYTEDEIKIMEADIDICKSAGVNGIVFGCLTNEGLVDVVYCERLLKRWGGPATFHRAIDECIDIISALKTVKSLGFERVLSSGGAVNAFEGMSTLRTMQSEFGESITILPGCGITSKNVIEILHTTGCHEIHATCKDIYESEIKNSGRGLFNKRSISSEFLVKELKSKIA